MYLSLLSGGSNVLLVIGAVSDGTFVSSYTRGGVIAAGGLDMQAGGRYSQLLDYICIQKPMIIIRSFYKVIIRSVSYSIFAILFTSNVILKWYFCCLIKGCYGHF